MNWVLDLEKNLRLDLGFRTNSGVLVLEQYLRNLFSQIGYFGST